MTALVAPTPFVVESGYLDGVVTHEMVAYEIAKAKKDQNPAYLFK